MESLEKVKTEINALLCTVNGAMPAHQLAKEYAEITGSPLPYGAFGFKTLDEFLASLTDILQWNRVQGVLHIRVVPNSENLHIYNLVKGQKMAKRAPRYAGGFPTRGRGGFNNPRPPRNLPGLPSQNRYPTRFYQPPLAIAQHQQMGVRQQVPTRPQQGLVPRSPSPTQPAQNKLAPVNPQAALPVVKPDRFPQPLIRHHQQQPVAQQVPVFSQQWIANAPLTTRASRPIQPPAPRPPYAGARMMKANLPNLRIGPCVQREKLRRFVESRALGEIRFDKNFMKHGKYIASVEVASSKFSSYPNEYANLEDAYEEAAKIALEELEAKYRSVPIVTYPETKDRTRLIEQVKKTAVRFYAGALLDFFIKDYEADHKESLPLDWIDAVKEATTEVDFIPSGDTLIVCLATASGDYATSPVPSNNNNDVSDSKLSTGFADLTVSDLIHQPLPVLAEPQMLRLSPGEVMPVVPARIIDSDSFTVRPLVVRGINSLGVRRIDTAESDEWDEMVTEMELHYTQHAGSLVPVAEMKPHCLYTCPVGGTWERIEFVETLDDGDVLVNLVDYGDQERTTLSSVYVLDPRFALLPSQGLHCSLHGLAPFKDLLNDSVIKYEIDSLLNKDYMAVVMSREPPSEVSVVLYDEDGQNMNELILNKLAAEIKPIALETGTLVRSTVISYISSVCDIFVLPDTPQKNVVESLLLLVSPRAAHFPNTPVLNFASVYLGPTATHGWCRMMVTSDQASAGSVAVRLIDYGDLEIVPANNLVDLKLLSPVLAEIPPQAVQVRLARVPPSPSHELIPAVAVKRLKELAPRTTNLLMRVVEPGSAPVVELFERLDAAHANKIVMINASMEVDESLYRYVDRASPQRNHPVPDVNNCHPIRRAMPRSTPSPTNESELVVVPDALLPPLNSCKKRAPCLVVICNVVNPRHFYVQPKDTMEQTSKMMKQLNEYCKQMDTPPLTVVNGGFYASLHRTSQEYRRVKVIKKEGPLYHVSYVDYGDQEFVPIEMLRPLPSEFAALPAQCMKASLYGVKPIDVDWSLPDVLFFRELVDKQLCAAYVMDVLGDRSLALALTDPNGKPEMEIARRLVECGHALVA